MMIHEITEKAGKYKARKRVGRGRGSGVGKTSGRGHKGAGSRSGYSRRPGFEGGQMQYFRRIPKRGFSNADFKTVYSIVNVASLQERFAKGDTVDVAALVEKGLVRNFKNPIKILGQGELSIALTVTADKVSSSAQKKIEDAGGSVTIIEKKKWMRADRKVKKAATPAEAVAETAEETPETLQEEAPEVQEAPQEESATETPEAEASDDSEGDE